MCSHWRTTMWSIRIWLLQMRPLFFRSWAQKNVFKKTTELCWAKTNCIFFFSFNLNRKCVSYCPSGYFADDQSKKCVKCNPECLECKGISDLDCIKCSQNKVLSVKTNACETDCPDGYLLSNFKFNHYLFWKVYFFIVVLIQTQKMNAKSVTVNVRRVF